MKCDFCVVVVAGSAVSGGVGASTVLIADQKYVDTTSAPKPVVQRRQSDIKIEEITADGTTRTVMRLSQGQLLDEPFLGSSLDSATMELEKESPSRLTVPGIVGRRESFSRRRSSASNITPLALPPRPAPLNRNTPITPDIVRDRINQLINQNAAIMEMPKADAPRPKRMSRQNSENLYPMSRSNSDVGLIGSPASLLPDTSLFSTPKSALPSPLTASEGISPPDSKGALSAHMHRAFSLPEAEIQKQTQKLHKQLAQKEKETAAAAAATAAAAAQQQEQQQQVALETNRIQQLVHVAKMASGVTGVKAGTPQEVVTGVKLAPASHGSPTSVVTYASSGGGGGGGGGAGTPLPQEIKIQIKLPKPGQTPAAATATVSTVHTQQMIGQPTVLYPPPPTIPFGSPPPGPVTIPLGGATLASPPVGQTAVLQPLGLVSDNAETIYSQHQTLSVGPNDGHAIKELLLRDRRSSLQPSRSHDTPLVVIDPPPKDDSDGSRVHVQTLPSAAVGLNVNSTGIPQHQHHHHEMRSMSVDSVSLSMGSIPHLSATTPTAPTTPISTPAGDIRFSAYDPLSPPRRGRPIGIRSKSEGLISPLVLGESPTTIETSGSKTSVQVSPGGVRMRMPVVPSPAPAPAQGLPTPAAGVSSPGGVAKLRPVAPATSRPQLKLMIPQPGSNILQGPTSSATPTPSNDAASPYLSPCVNSPLLTPGGSSTTPGGTGGTLSQPQTPTTPSQFAKLKLKGKLLMKRSMSIEKMERERAALGAGAGTPTPGASTDVNPFSRLSAEGLQRSASIDETKLSRNNKRLSFGGSMMESPTVQPSGGRPLGRALSAQGNARRLGRLGRSLSIHEEPEEIMMAEAATTIVTPITSQAVVDKSVVTIGPAVVAGAATVESVPMQLPSLPQSSLIIDDKTLATKLSLHLLPVPVNKGFEFFKAGVANMAPYFKHSFSQSKDAAPLLVNAPIKLVTTASDISRQESKSSDASSTSPVSGITAAPSVVSQMSSESSTPGGETPTSGGGASKPPGRLISDENGAGNGRLSEKAQVGHGFQGH